MITRSREYLFGPCSAFHMCIFQESVLMSYDVLLASRQMLIVFFLWPCHPNS